MHKWIASPNTFNAPCLMTFHRKLSQKMRNFETIERYSS
uniref:Uncharacterized protein n=1 Tax=Ascaris lumbricoides TaxID=6252 RepID=A0A9J2P1K0_ASCLU